MRLPENIAHELLARLIPANETKPGPSVNEQIDELTESLLAAFNSHQQPMLVLLEELGKFYIELERNVGEPVINGVHRALLILSARLRSDYISLRQVILAGQLPGAAILARSLLEVMEISMAVVGEEDLAERYIGASSDKQFWKNHIAYGKVYESMKYFYLHAGAPEEEASRSVEQHKLLKNSLSGHVHATDYSAMLTKFQPSVLHPKAYVMHALGSPDPSFVRLLLNLLVETASFSFGLLGTAQRSSGEAGEWLNSRPELVRHIALSAYLLDGIIQEHGQQIDEYYKSFEDSE